MKRMMRVLIGCVASYAAIFGFAGLLLVLVIADAVLFSAWEAALIGLFFDLIWQPTFGVFAAPWYTIIALALLWASEPVRREFLS